ncbi:MAG TPA: PH domain-containing protein [Vicinamibacterales bacterium]|nr:PH domain-containing protein [Vicinamibacterales bacterium]
MANPEAPVAALPVADGELHRLDPAIIPMHRVVGLIVTVCVSMAVLIGGVIGLVVGSLPGQSLSTVIAVWTLSSALLGWFCFVWPPIEYRYLFYRLDGDGIEIRHGVFWRTVVSVPRSRVQHLDVSQGPLQRSFGLGTLRIYTAGTEHAQVDLAGLEHGLALRIRDFLLPREAGDVV